MSKLSIILKILIIVYAGQSSVLAGRGRLLWSDEFNSEAAFLNNWNFEIGGNGWGNNELQYYTDKNHKLQNGQLTIEARKEDFGGSRFTSTRLISKNGFKYGVYEMSAKLPSGRGTWPAFWLLGALRPLRWPDDGEIDVMEHVGYNPGQVHGTIHCKKYNHVLGTDKGNFLKINNAFDQFHNYTLDWSPNRIEVFLDGFKYFDYPKESSSYDVWPFDNPHNILLNFAVGGNWGGAQGVDETIWPKSYVIEYVRHYEHVDDPAPVLTSQKTIALKALVNNKYVSADNFGNNPLIANKNTKTDSEKFEMSTYSDGYVTLRSYANNKYVVAENYGKEPLIASRLGADDWEKFRLVSNNDGTVTLQAKANYRFVSAENYGNSPLIANKAAFDNWEKFYLEYL